MLFDEPKPSGPYMPKSDKGKKKWMTSFVGALARHQEDIGISDEYLEYITRTVKRFADAHQKAAAPGQRCKSLTAAKNTARKEAVALCRSLAMQLKADPSLTNAQKVGLGLHLDDEHLTPVKTPRVQPELIVTGAPGGGHIIRFKPRIAFGSKAKPKGCTHLLLYVAIGDRPLGVEHARLIAAPTKQPYEVVYPSNSDVTGSVATYYGRWLTNRGEFGRWSPGRSMVIARANGRKEHPCRHIFGTRLHLPIDPPAPEAPEDDATAEVEMKPDATAAA